MYVLLLFWLLDAIGIFALCCISEPSYSNYVQHIGETILFCYCDTTGISIVIRIIYCKVTTFSTAHVSVNTIYCKVTCFSTAHVSVNTIYCKVTTFSTAHVSVNTIYCKVTTFSTAHVSVNTIISHHGHCVWYLLS